MIRRRMRTGGGGVAGVALAVAFALGAISLGGSTSASAHTAAELPAPVVKALKRHRLPQDSISIWVQEVGGAQPLVAHRPDVPRNPASTIKLLTTFAALELLGPGFTWTTDFYALGEVSDGRLKGDLVVAGRGDPFLVDERLLAALTVLRETSGIRDVAGRLVLDNSRFEVSNEPEPGAFDKRPYSPQNALPDALLVNFNMVEFRLVPRGDKASFRLEPPVAGLKVRNRFKWHKAQSVARCRFGVSLAAPLSVRSPIDAPLPAVTIGGRGARDCAGYTMRHSLLPPVRFADGVIRGLWARLGGRIEGTLALERAPSGATPIYRHHSLPLTDIVERINKHSNNVMSRNLLLTLGAEQFEAPGTIEKGRRALGSVLGRWGIEAPELHVANGSGLAREARISARSMGELLLAAARSPVWPEFERSLPIASRDGTMRRRLRGYTGAKGVRAKTGLLNGVRSLAGYVEAGDGRQYAVAILHEHRGVHMGIGTSVQDALLRWLLQRN